MLLPLPRALTLVSIQSAVGAPQVPGMPRNMRRRIQSRLPRKRWLPRKFPVPSPPVLARDLLPRRPTRFRRLRRRVRARPRSETRFTWVSMDVHARGAAGDAHTTCSVEHAAAHCLIFRVRRRVAHSSTYLSSTSLDQQKKKREKNVAVTQITWFTFWGVDRLTSLAETRAIRTCGLSSARAGKSAVLYLQ